jgi:hypothetical protein
LQQQQEYSTFIDSVRAAAGHDQPDGIMRTQGIGGALIRADINMDGFTMSLWLSPDNMYLRGYTNAAGETYYFNDYSLPGVMDYIRAHQGPGYGLLPSNRMHELPYGSDYRSLERAANRGRGVMPLSYDALRQSFFSLVASPNGESTARALMFFIQYISEASRFVPLSYEMNQIMGGWVYRDGLPLGMQELENNWQGLTIREDRFHGGHVPLPFNVGPHVRHSLRTLDDLRRYLAMGLGNLGGVSGNPPWWRDQL